MDLQKVKEDVASRVYYHVKVKDFVKKLNTTEENNDSGLGEVAWVVAHDGHSFYFGLLIDDPEESVNKLLDKHKTKFNDRIVSVVKSTLKMTDEEYEKYISENLDNIFFEFYTRTFIDVMLEKYGKYNFSALKEGRFFGLEYDVDMVNADMEKISELVKNNKIAEESEEFKLSLKLFNANVKNNLMDYFTIKADFQKELEGYKVDILDFLMGFHDSDKAADIIIRYFKETK